MKINYPLIILSLFTLFTHAQNWQWAKNAGGIYSDKATDIDIDAQGNTYVSGFYNVGQPANTTVHFGNITPPTDWGKEGFLAKVDAQGNWMWVRSALGGWDERILGICVDKVNGFVYATGTTWYDISSFGSCSNASNPNGYADEIFVGKFDLAGNCQWVITAGGGGDDHGHDLITDKQGNIYLTGFISDYGFGDPAYFGNIMIPLNAYDSLAFVAKISPSGTWQWVRTFGGTDVQRDNRVAIDSLNNVYIAGGYYGTKQFGSTQLTSTNNSRDIFVTKYDNNGNFIWVRSVGDSLDDRANGITIDNRQNIYITGEFRDKVFFGTDTINNYGGPGGRDIFVAKLRPNGNWVWAKKAGSKSGGDRGNAICTNNMGNIFITGQITDTTKFGGNITLNISDSTEAFVAAIDSNGTWRWAKNGGGIYEDRGTGITCNDACNVYVSGYYQNTGHFGTINLSNYGSKDIFVAALNNVCFSYTGVDDLTDNKNQIICFPNPAANFITFKVDVELNSPVNFTVSDLTGKIVGQYTNIYFQNKSFSIDIEKLSSGMYIVNIEGKTEKFYLKFMKL